jgi:hypothetical protein
MTPEAITLLFREVCEAFPPLEGKPSDDNLTTIRETLLPILMEIAYDQLGGGSLPHSNPHGTREVYRQSWQQCICLTKPSATLRQKHCQQCIDRCLSPWGSSPPRPT